MTRDSELRRISTDKAGLTTRLPAGLASYSASFITISSFQLSADYASAATASFERDSCQRAAISVTLTPGQGFTTYRRFPSASIDSQEQTTSYLCCWRYQGRRVIYALSRLQR